MACMQGLACASLGCTHWFGQCAVLLCLPILHRTLPEEHSLWMHVHSLGLNCGCAYTKNRWACMFMFMVMQVAVELLKLTEDHGLDSWVNPTLDKKAFSIAGVGHDMNMHTSTLTLCHRCTTHNMHLVGRCSMYTSNVQLSGISYRALLAFASCTPTAWAEPVDRVLTLEI